MHFILAHTMQANRIILNCYYIIWEILSELAEQSELGKYGGVTARADN